jgi:non-ribosomal peptide synthetase component F
MEAQLAYWRKQLANVTEPKLPTDRPRPPIPTYRGATHFVEFPKRLIDPLTALGQQVGATLFMVMLAAFTTLLHRYAGQDDIVIGCPTANRSRAEIEALIGFFVSTQVIRADCSGSPTFRELIGRVRQVCMEAYANQDVPFERVVAELHPDRDPSRNPLFQVVLALQNPLIEKLPADDVIFSPDEFDTTAVRFDLEWHIWEVPAGIQGAIVYSTDLFDPATIERMAGHFQVLLEGIVANPDRKLTELPLLTLTEQHQLLMGTNPRRRKRREE